MRDIVFRAARPGDVAECAALLAAEGLPTADLTAARLALVAEADGVLAGAIGLEQYGTAGLLRSLVVSGVHRSGGLGRRLVEALERHAAAKGVTELWLLTIDADRYFERLGYRRESREHAPPAIAATEEFTRLCPGDAVLMRKAL